MTNPYDNLIKRAKIIGGDYPEMIGNIYDVIRTLDRYDAINVNVNNVDKSPLIYFNKNEYQIVTPVEFEGVPICIGDTVERSYIVYGFKYCDAKWVILMANNGDYESSCYWSSGSTLSSHTPLFQKEETLAAGKEITIQLDGKDYKAKIIK